MLEFIRSGKHPHEVLVMLAAFFIGAAGSFLPETANPATFTLFGALGGQLFFAAISLFALVTLWGVKCGGIEGLLIERVGLIVTACFFLGFTWAVIDYRGLAGISASLFPLLLAAANVWRCCQIRKDLYRLRSALLSDEGDL